MEEQLGRPYAEAQLLVGALIEHENWDDEKGPLETAEKADPKILKG